MVASFRCARLIFYIVVTSIFGNFAYAQLNDSCGCNAGLAPEYFSSNTVSEEGYAFLHQIDEKQFHEIKKSGSADGKYLELFRASADYGEFDTKRREYLSKTSYKHSKDQSMSIVHTGTPTEDWLSCKRACIQQLGFHCGTSIITTSTAAISCSWKPEGAALKKTVSIVMNTQVISSETIDPNTTKDWQFARPVNQDLLLTFTLDGLSSQSIKIAAIPPKSNGPLKRFVVNRDGFRFTEASFNSIPNTTPEVCSETCLNNLSCFAWNYKVAAGSQSKTCWLFKEHFKVNEESAIQNIGGEIWTRHQ